MQKVNEIFGFLSPKQLTTLDNKTLREEAATTLANLYPHDLEKDELAVEIESFKYSVIGERCCIGICGIECHGHVYCLHLLTNTLLENNACRKFYSCADFTLYFENV
ncbi:hypothetical protein AVEN_253999-1 [Araneus ventricosus]|uniref:Uncharacterized protein n=1 Tax=Araneus ventricosus TaxID=182803 RepID=A0A4Y2E8Y0_ARAVE|nr:hypothetical protein AVEN_253999-1 [Araneus ventricosus]